MGILILKIMSAFTNFRKTTVPALNCSQCVHFMSYASLFPDDAWEPFDCGRCSKEEQDNDIPDAVDDTEICALYKKA